MIFKSQTGYREASDDELVRLILTPPHNEEAAVFLLYNRYAPLLRSIYKSQTSDPSWYEDCVHELFIHLKGKDRVWLPLTSFARRSSFGTWLKRVAWNKFHELLPKLIDNPENTVSVDGDNPDKAPIQLPDEGVEDYEQRQLRVQLLEAIRQLDDPDQRFVILKRLQGYDSKEIALLLQRRWKKHGIRKFNNRREEVVPDAAYVDVRTQRAKEKLRKILAGIK